MSLPDPCPPARDAFLRAEEEGQAREDARFWPFWRLIGWVRQGIAFRGSASGRVWLASEEHRNRAELTFASTLGDGTVILEPSAGGWLRAEVRCGGRTVFRAWLDDPYEELELWPDGASGEGDPPGRISKRGAWVQLRAEAFAGVPGDEHGWFELEDEARF